MLNKNMGSIDRILRVIVGVALLGAFFVFPDASWRNWLLIGVIPLATGLISSCPLYSIFGIRSCPLSKK